ncbi:MAG TPA: DnaJ domain-containing protein [Polyangiaceae bacterium]|nr:DnaJ domain-containing protein [Polyangiaceae bacterium]
MHWVLAAAVIAIIVLFLLPSPGAGRRKQIEHTLLGALTVAAVVLVLTKAGMPWLALALALVATSFQRFTGLRRDAARSENGGAPPARWGKSRMTREEAYRVLGLSPGATKEEIVAEYRRLMKRVHPDQGGTTYLAAQLNEAKDCLLG